MKIYDAFLFFNELDLLEIRLNLLNDLVDYFVISECTISFSGKEKPLYFLENKNRFKKFEKKIIYQVIRDTPTNFITLNKYNNPVNEDQRCVNKIYTFLDKATNFPKNELHWGRDFFQRECLHRALIRCENDDIVMFSDIDEIPNPEILKNVILNFPSNNIYTLMQKEFWYYLNTYRQDGWMGPRVAQYSTLKDISLNKIRAFKKGARPEIDTVDVQNGGWHFTSLGTPEQIIHKIEMWSHQEFNTDRIKKNVKKNVEAGKDIFRRFGKKQLEVIDINEENYPKWIVANKEKYTQLIRTEPMSEKIFTYR